MIRMSLWRGLALSSFLVVAVTPARGAEGDDRSLSPYFLVEGGDPSIDRFPLKSTHVAASINGVIADVLVTQTYVNEGTRTLNARYVFPGSTRASVHGMKFTIGDHVVTARIRERQQAKREFESAKAEGKSASLLEQQRPNVFTMSVANILPSDRVEVELHYTELLVPEAGTYQFVYPTVVAPRYTGGAPAPAVDAAAGDGNPYLRQGRPQTTEFGIDVTLSTGIPLQDVASPTHQVDVAWEGQDLARVALHDPEGRGGDRDFILDYRLAGEQIQSGLLLYQGATENFFLLMVQPPERVRLSDVPPREYIFVLDVSGSMDGFPLDTAKSVVRELIGRLRDTDLFDVVLFSGDSRVTSPASVPANEANLRQAMLTIDRQRGGGGTELAQALQTAMALPRDDRYARTVVVITDGFISAERDVFDLIRRNLGRTNVFCFGIGSSVNRHLVEGIAVAGQGEPFVVTRPAEAHDAVERFGAYVESPLLTEARVQFDGLDAYDVEPPAWPDLFAQRPLVVFGKWRGQPSGSISISGREAGGPYAHTFPLSEYRPLPENQALPFLWARARIARLSDYSGGPEDPEAVRQITSLGLGYSVLTRYTSFVAVMEMIRRPEERAADVAQASPMPQGVTDRAVGGDGYAMGPEPGFWLLAAFATATLMLLALRGRRRTDGPADR